MIQLGNPIFTALIIFGSFFFMASNLYLIKNLLSNGKFLTILQFFNLNYIVFIYIGATALNLYRFDYEDYYGLYERQDLLFRMWLLASAGLMLIPIGAIIFNEFVKFYPRKYLSDWSLDRMFSNSIDSSLPAYVFALFILFISILVFLLYKSTVGDIAVLHLFQGLTPADLGILRSDATNNFSGKFHRYQLFLKTIPNMLLIVTFLLKNKDFKWKVLFYVLLLINIFFALLNVEKSPVFKVILLLLIAQTFVSFKINFKKLAFVFVIMMAGLILLYSFVMGMEGRFISEIVGAIFHRIFIGQVHPLYWWQLYLEQHSILGFSGMPNPGGILPFTPVSMTVLIYEFAHPEMIESGIRGSMPTVFFAYWFLSFGYFVSLVAMIVFGILIQAAECFTIVNFKIKPNVYLVAFYVILVDYFSKYLAEGYEGIMFDLQWIVPLLMYIIYSGFVSVIKVAQYKKRMQIE